MTVRIVNVPKVPSSAFNKNRRASDLVRQQVSHLQHVVQRRAETGALVTEAKRARTEGQAARFIAKATSLLHPQASPPPGIPTPPKAATTRKTAKRRRAQAAKAASTTTRRRKVRR